MLVVNGYAKNLQYADDVENIGMYFYNFAQCSCMFYSVCLQLETFEMLKSALVTEKATSFDDCIQWARNLFQENYSNQIRQLLFNFPADSTTSSGAMFWSGPKRCPTPLVFDATNDTHLNFIVAAANLRAFMFGIPQNNDLSYISGKVANMQAPHFEPRAGVRIDANEAEANARNNESVGKCTVKYKHIPFMSAVLCNLSNQIIHVHFNIIISQSMSDSAPT